MNQKLLILISLLSLMSLSGCTEQDYTNFSKFSSDFDFGNGINVPSLNSNNITNPFNQNGFSFQLAMYGNFVEEKIILLLFDVNYGEGWKIINDNTLGGTGTLIPGIGTIGTICNKGKLTGENANYYYCRSSFERKLIHDDGTIGPYEKLDLYYFIDIRKAISGDVTSLDNKGLIIAHRSDDKNNVLPQNAFGIIDSNYQSINN